MNPATYRNLIYTYAIPAALAAGILQVLLTVTAVIRSADPEMGLTGAMGVTFGVVALMQAIGSLLLFPFLFTWVSQRLGATSRFDEVVGITAVAAVPGLLLLLLGVFTVPGDILLLGSSLLSMGLFVWGLSQMNETELLPTLGHTVAVWLILLVGGGLAFLMLDLLF